MLLLLNPMLLELGDAENPFGITTEDGEPITTEDDEQIVTEEGA